jgi:hypothetical protein
MNKPYRPYIVVKKGTKLEKHFLDDKNMMVTEDVEAGSTFRVYNFDRKENFPRAWETRYVWSVRKGKKKDMLRTYVFYFVDAEDVLYFSEVI